MSAATLTPRQRLKVARAHRKVLEQVRFEAITRDDFTIAERDQIRSAWAASHILETIAEQQAARAAA